MRFAILCLFLMFVTGCSEPPAPESPWMSTADSTADIPADLLAVAKKKLPAVKFDTARKIKVKGEDVFEIRGKQPNGKVREVEVSVGGNVVEVE
jgi:hypothetical protein